MINTWNCQNVHLLSIYPFVAEMKVFNTYHRFNGTPQFSIATKIVSTLKSNVRPKKTVPNEHPYVFWLGCLTNTGTVLPLDQSLYFILNTLNYINYILKSFDYSSERENLNTYNSLIKTVLTKKRFTKTLHTNKTTNCLHLRKGGKQPSWDILIFNSFSLNLSGGKTPLEDWWIWNPFLQLKIPNLVCL